MTTKTKPSAEDRRQEEAYRRLCKIPKPLPKVEIESSIAFPLDKNECDADGSRYGYACFGDELKPKAGLCFGEKRDYIADFFKNAWNGCVELNPTDPAAVAKNLFEIISATREMTETKAGSDEDKAAFSKLLRGLRRAGLAE